MPSYSSPQTATYTFPVSLSTGLVNAVTGASNYAIKAPPKVSGVLRDVQISLLDAFTNATTAATSITVGTASSNSDYLKSWTPIAKSTTSAAAQATYRASDTTVTASAGIQQNAVIPKDGTAVVTFTVGTGGTAAGGSALCTVIVDWS